MRAREGYLPRQLLGNNPSAAPKIGTDEENSPKELSQASLTYKDVSNERDLSFPKIISGRIGGAVQPGSEWRR